MNRLVQNGLEKARALEVVRRGRDLIREAPHLAGAGLSFAAQAVALTFGGFAAGCDTKAVYLK